MPLPIDDVDLDALVLARNDTHPDGDWWFDPRTGESLYLGVDDDADVPALAAGTHVLIPCEPQPVSDIDEFIALVDDETEAARLAGSFRRKGGARRFREAVARGPYAQEWEAFTLRREGVRAIDWLVARGLVEPASAAARRHELA